MDYGGGHQDGSCECGGWVNHEQLYHYGSPHNHFYDHSAPHNHFYDHFYDHKADNDDDHYYDNKAHDHIYDDTAPC
jgi:hypothetical protein